MDAGRDCGPAPGLTHSSLPATCVTCQCRTSTETCSNLRLRCRLLCVQHARQLLATRVPSHAPQYVLAQPRLHRLAQNKTSGAKQQDKAYRVPRLVPCASRRERAKTAQCDYSAAPIGPATAQRTGGAVDRSMSSTAARCAHQWPIRSGSADCIAQNCCATTSANLLSTNLGALTPGREGRSARERESAMARTRPPSSCSIRCTCTEDGRRDDRPEQV